MPASKPRPAASPASSRPERTSGVPMGVAEASFISAFEPLIVDDPTPFDFDGSLNRNHMRAIWAWLIRDIDPDLKASMQTAVFEDNSVEAVIDARLPALGGAIRKALADANDSPDAQRRLNAQLGGEETSARLPVVVNMFRCRPLLAKASAFGRASNTLHDEAALGQAIASMPLKDPGVASLLLHAVVGQSANPGRLTSAIIPLAGNAREATIIRAQFSPVIDGVLAHAQNQLSRLVGQDGLFADADLICKAVTRFHRLIRAVSGYFELERGSRWSSICAELTKQMAQRIEPRLREVSVDVSQSLRKPRDGSDRVDPDRLLAALNGIYLLASLRDARESLALNALFDKIWQETGQSLEVLLDRNMELYKQNPGDEGTAERLEMGIKMAEIRFNAEYASILRRGKDVIDRREEPAARQA